MNTHNNSQEVKFNVPCDLFSSNQILSGKFKMAGQQAVEVKVSKPIFLIGLKSLYIVSTYPMSRSNRFYSITSLVYAGTFFSE